MFEFTEEFWAIATDHFLVHWGLCAVLFLVDTFLYNFCYGELWNKMKLNTLKVPDTWRNIVIRVLCNQLFVSLPIIYIFANTYPHETFRWSWPFRFAFAMLLFEPLFYYSHRLLHVGFLYKYVHKIHHRWLYPMGISTLYAHPLEHAISNLLPVIVSGYLAGLPIELMRWWHILTLSNGIIVSHGGYKWWGYNNLHDMHHVYQNCNYGALGFLDRFHNTARSMRDMKKKY